MAPLLVFGLTLRQKYHLALQDSYCSKGVLLEVDSIFRSQQKFSVSSGGGNFLPSLWKISLDRYFGKSFVNVRCNSVNIVLKLFFQFNQILMKSNKVSSRFELKHFNWSSEEFTSKCDGNILHGKTCDHRSCIRNTWLAFVAQLCLYWTTRYPPAFLFSSSENVKHNRISNIVKYSYIKIILLFLFFVLMSCISSL